MPKLIRRWVCVLALASMGIDPALVASDARATAFSTDQSDLYYVATESGWGMQLVQRGPVIFVTIFVYDPGNNPIWYTATLSPAGNLVWSGDLYLTRGSWFGTVPFNPASVTLRKVGTMAWNGSASTVTYSVDGVQVAKTVVRQPLVVDDYSGTYLGAFHLTATGCTDPAANGSGEIPLTTITVTQSGQALTIALSVLGLTLSISGTLSPNGQFGVLHGAYTSTPGEMGVATVSDMNVQANALSATFALSSTNVGCHNSGYVAGIRSRP